MIVFEIGDLAVAHDDIIQLTPKGNDPNGVCLVTTFPLPWNPEMSIEHDSRVDFVPGNELLQWEWIRYDRLHVI